MRLIDADACIDYIRNNNQHAWEALAYAPTIDAVEVVRCGECEHWKCNPNTKNYGVCRKVSYDDFEVVMEKDDFCSYGILREVIRNVDKGERSRRRYSGVDG